MVLIISSKNDDSTNIVCSHLTNSSVIFFRIDTEDNIELESLAISKLTQQIVLKKDNKTVILNEVNVVWYRNGFLFEKFLRDVIDKYRSSKAIHKYHADEIEYLNQYIFKIINSKTILSSYEKGGLNKLFVLKCAADVGLNIPETIVTTNRNSLVEFCANQPSVVIKPVKDCISVRIKDSVYIPYTRVFEASEITQYSFFPICVQQCIKPLYELRIFFMEELFFSIAIISKNDKGSLVQDWRYNYKNGFTKFTRFNLPDYIQKKLLMLIKKAGDISSGSIDMIIDYEWNYYFLEINPLGQFRFISHLYDNIIEKLIADKIMLYEKK